MISKILKSVISRQKCQNKEFFVSEHSDLYCSLSDQDMENFKCVRGI